MAASVPEGIIHRIRELALPLRSESQTDAELLCAFALNRDEGAFAALVLRYRQAVWDTCRHALGNDADAEDAFQAVFIALARDARKVNAGTIEGWLRTVAARASTNVRVAARRRTNAHQRLCDRAAPAQASGPPDDELHAILRQEVAELPERIRVALSLYYLEGKTQAEVGRILGLTDRAVAARIRRGLDALRERLAQRGAIVSVASLVAALGWLATGAAEAAVPTWLTATATATALAAADGQPATGPAAQLAAGLTGAGEYPRLKLYGLVLAVCGLGAVGGAVVLADRPLQTAPPKSPPAELALLAEPSRLDRLGDELPVGAVARIGTHRFRVVRSSGTGDVTFVTNGNTLASVHGESAVTLWDSVTGKSTATFDGPAGARWVSADPSGRRLAVAGAAEVWVWELGAGSPRFLWKWTAAHTPPQASITALAFSPDGSVVAVGDREGKRTRLLRSDTGGEVASLTGQPLALTAAGGSYLAVIGGSHPAAWGDRVTFWDATRGRTARVVAAPAGELFVDVAQSRAGHAALRTATGEVRVIEITTGKELGRWSTQSGARRGLAFLADGSEVIEVTQGQFRFRNPVTGTESRPDVSVPALVLYTMNLNLDVSKQLSPDGKHLATGTYGEVTIWDVASGRPAGPDGQVQGAIRALTFSPDGRAMLTFADRAAEVRVWDAVTGTPGQAMSPSAGDVFAGVGWGPDTCPLSLVRPPLPPAPGGLLRSDPHTGAAVQQLPLPDGQQWVPGPTGRVGPFAVTPSGLRVAVASGTTIDVLEPGGKSVRRMTARAAVAGLVLSADGRTLAAVTHFWNPRPPGSGPQPPRVSVEVWDVTTGRLHPAPASHETWDLFRSLPALSSDGRWMAAVTWDRTITLTEVRTGRTGQQFETSGRPQTLAFSPDGRQLAAGSTNGTVSLWDLAAGRVVRRFSGHRGEVNTLSFAPDGYRLGSGSSDGTALIWDTTNVRATGVPLQTGRALRDAVLGADIAASHRASLALADRPEEAVRLLTPDLVPEPEPDAARVSRWVDELGSENVEVRERAETALERAGEVAEPALRERLAADPPVGVRSQVERLLSRLESLGPPARTAAGRAVAVLERAGTPAARKALEDAAGRAGPELKLEIEAALTRMPEGSSGR
ncbi:sigma-70 family RNA polymerase sigma factor [Gemmata sp. JC673]|uniref:Sigma-70 family RNA polymerase sigma factor n=1 Tax=Gemmata algarum TaxID=2975278 RepID=A0ABU5F8M2_9BACT|nr:sigma-70 family RNA polymerase sigma factor [Gemmata algarum]MDY3562738.1 sigma-70 family RNA polymerase sigma factor [Gemmata algarum]